MKVPTKKAATQAGARVAGAGIGIGAGRVTNQYFPENKQTAGIAKLVLAGMLVYGSTMVADNSALKSMGKGLAEGFAGEKLVSGIADLLGDSSIAVVSDSDSDTTKLAQTALGLRGADCGCSTASTSRFVQLPALNFTPRTAQPINMVETAPNTYGVADMLR